jgi:hypothetical protein
MALFYLNRSKKCLFIFISAQRATKNKKSHKKSVSKRLQNVLFVKSKRLKNFLQESSEFSLKALAFTKMTMQNQALMASAINLHAVVIKNSLAVNQPL